MRRGFAIAAVLFTLACQQREPATRAAQEKKLEVGLLTPGSIHDGGWNAIAYEGLQRIKSEVGADVVSNQETKSPAEIEEGFRSYGSRGFDLVFGHGFEYQDPAMRAGKEFPRTIFITTSGSAVAANVSPMRFGMEEATYLLGVIAARESKRGKAGVIGGINLPSIASTFAAFKAGAQSVDPKFEVKEVYTGNFDDAGAAKLATQTLIHAGADFIFHQANEAGRGVFQACSENKIRCFGSNKDQQELAPDVIVASAVLDVPGAFVRMARLVRDRQFKPGIQYLGTREGIVGVVWNERLKSQLEPETVAEVERLQAEIRAGRVQVPRGF